MTTKQKQWLVAGVVWVVGCLGLWLVVGCQLLPNGLFGGCDKAGPAGPGPLVGPPYEPSQDAGKWDWLSDPALWGSVAVGVVYVFNQVRKSRKYNSGSKGKIL